MATGVIATLALTTDYTVALNADQDSSPGGSITLIAGNLASGVNLVITTDMAAVQGLDLTNGGGFYPDVINAALDTLTILVQQLLVTTQRTMQAPVIDAEPVFTLPPAAERAGMVLMFDGNGNPVLSPPAPGGTVPGPQAASGTIDGSNRTFSFSAAPGSTPAPLVFAGGVYQTPGIDYALPTFVGGSTWQLVFTNVPTQGPITVLLLG